MRKQLSSGLQRRRVDMVVAAIVALSVSVEVMADCRVSVDFYNDQRRFPGEVNVECFGPHAWDGGYGNWGVISNYGGIQDTNQFAGWKPKGTQRHWQSCTGEHPKPDCDHYNDNGCRGQKANPDNKRRYASYSYFPGGYCEDIGVVTIGDVYMHVYELDEPDADDPVASLLYGDMDIPLSCTDRWRCRGESSWLAASSGGGTIAARVRIEVRTSLWMNPTGH